jgi:hypothetical protein
MINSEVTVVEKNHMGGVLTGHALAHRAVADMVIDRIVIRVGVNMIATSSILVRHIYPPCSLIGSGQPTRL